MLTPSSAALAFTHALACSLTRQFTGTVAGPAGFRPAPGLAPPCLMLIDIDELDIVTDIVFLWMPAALHSLKYLQGVIMWQSFIQSLPGFCQCGEPLLPRCLHDLIALSYGEAALPSSFILQSLRILSHLSHCIRCSQYRPCILRSNCDSFHCCDECIPDIPR